jgi:hypothetical protein
MQPVFKLHSVYQQDFFPLNLNDLIPENYFIRLID